MLSKKAEVKVLMGLSMGMLDASLAVLSCAATQAHWKVTIMSSYGHSSEKSRAISE